MSNIYRVVLREYADYSFQIEATDAPAARREAFSRFFEAPVQPYEYGDLTLVSIEPVEYDPLPNPA